MDEANVELIESVAPRGVSAMHGTHERPVQPRAVQRNAKGSLSVVEGEGGSGAPRTRPIRGHVPGPGSVDGGPPARVSLDAEGEAPPSTRQPSTRQRYAKAGLVPRAVVMGDRGAVGVVLEVSDNGTIEVAFTEGRLRTCTPADMLEVVAGPREWHPGRHVVLEQWHQRPADWSNAHDEATRSFMLAAWCMMDELAERMGFVLREDLVIQFTATRPRVRVPSILRLTGDAGRGGRDGGRGGELDALPPTTEHRGEGSET